MLPIIFIYIPYFPDFPFSQMNDSVPNKSDSVVFFFKAGDNRFKSELFSILRHIYSLHKQV